MLGFFSKEKDDSVKVKKDEIYFVSCKDNKSLDEIKMIFSPTARLFAEKLNLNKVFLHFGKEIIEYDIEI